MHLGDIPEGITLFLERWSAGDKAALGTVLDLVYDRLREEARRQLARYGYHDQVVQPTQLVHEAYIKFHEEHHPEFLSRADFEWFASKIIRNVIVDHIRAMNRAKRKPEELVPIDDQRDIPSLQADGLTPEVFLDLADAMARLEALNPRRGQIVTLRFIMGKTIMETAEIMNLSATMIKKEWLTAQTWLYKQLKGA